MDFLQSIPKHYNVRHLQYCFPNIVPKNLEWMCDSESFEKSNATIYFADKDIMILYIWHKNKPIVKITLTVTEAGDKMTFKVNVIITELQANTITQGTSEGIIGLTRLLDLQGIKIPMIYLNDT